MAVCEQCRYFKPDTINPEAGIGQCSDSPSHGAFYPAEKHLCRDFLRAFAISNRAHQPICDYTVDTSRAVTPIDFARRILREAEVAALAARDEEVLDSTKL
jgi:hypothetical protein